MNRKDFVEEDEVGEEDEMMVVNCKLNQWLETDWVLYFHFYFSKHLQVHYYYEV